MPNDMNMVIDVKGLCKSFAHKPVVSKVDLQIKAGEIFGFLGPNGSGKTTTLRMICGLLKPDAGSGTCAGYNILTESESIKRQVGYMTQKFSLYKDLSVRENLEFIARMYGLPDIKQCVDDGLDKLNFPKSQAKKLAGHLSGGWQQRLALAGAILHHPQVLLLDEPTAGVDPQARREFWEEIHRLAETGITSLVTTHYMDEAERCHRLAYLSEGHILARGTIADVIQSAHLTVWAVSGASLFELKEKLQYGKNNQNGIEQVTPFGNELHVVGRDATTIEQTIEPLKTQYSWKQVPPSLEDVFINLVAQTQREN
jgi:ABC-2 type transport system ATP-binding protein